MKTFSVAVSAVISAPASRCYEAIADYRVAHPQIVPPKYFGPIIVEQGGTGAGTRIKCTLRLVGQEHTFTSDVTEPVPGRVLVESIIESGGVTTFTVVSDASGNARVTIETTLPRAKGVRGFLERIFTQRMFPGIYAEELQRLAALLGGKVLGTPETMLT